MKTKKQVLRAARLMSGFIYELENQIRVYPTGVPTEILETLAMAKQEFKTLQWVLGDDEIKDM